MRTLLLLIASAALLLCIPAADAAKAKKVCRDVKTGQFVTPAYAKKYPGLTACETVK